MFNQNEILLDLFSANATDSINTPPLDGSYVMQEEAAGIFFTALTRRAPLDYPESVMGLHRLGN